jgi:hypothetical protein
VATLELPITFNQNSSFIQSVILSRINNIITGLKLPGKSFVQSSSFGFGKGSIEGNSDLKGYTPIYNEKGEVIGANPAEIAIPWRFTDPKTGKLLPFDKYCNADGTPKLKDENGNDTGLWDNKMLQVIGLRIPNTGANTMGFYKIVRFLPGYKDIAQVPVEVLAQMNSDLDFDKFVTYIYNHQIVGGKISKIEGVMDETQKKAKTLLSNPETIKRAVRYDLNLNNPEYGEVAGRLDETLNRLIKENGTDLVDDLNEAQDAEDAAYTIDDLLALERAEKLEMLRHRLGEVNIAEINSDLTRVEQWETSHLDSFDMATFASNTPDFLMAIQSKHQLENARIDIYHMMLREPSVMKRMLSWFVYRCRRDYRYHGQLWFLYSPIADCRFSLAE